MFNQEGTGKKDKKKKRSQLSAPEAGTRRSFLEPELRIVDSSMSVVR